MAVCTARARNGRISTFGLKSDVRQHRDPRPRFLLRRGNVGNLAINKGYIAYFLGRIAISGLKSDVTIVFEQ